VRARGRASGEDGEPAQAERTVSSVTSFGAGAAGEESIAQSDAAAACRSPCRAARAMVDVQETTSRGAWRGARWDSLVERGGGGRTRDGAAATAICFRLVFSSSTA
jgi:hypothetical protein